MKTPLVLLLALSLAGNAVLAVMSLRSSNAPARAATESTATAVTQTTPGSKSTSAAATEKPAATIEVTPAVWHTLKPTGNLKTLVANLRAAGFPPNAIRAVTNAMLTEQLGNPGENLPFWKQNSNNPEYLLAQQQLSTRRREMYEDLLGADARPSAALDPGTRERRYGALSDDKIDRIENLNRDISELRTKLYAERKNGDPQAMMSAQAAAEQELRAELSTILTPAELEQYEMRSSPSASTVMRNLKGFDVTETEYAALYKAQKAYDAVDPMRNGGTFNQDAMIARNVAQAELIEQARTVLADDRFYEYLKSADPNYARAAQFTANYPNITPAMTYELSQIERNYQNSMMSLARSVTPGTTPSADRMAQLTSARKEYQDKIASLLGPEAAAAYAQRGRGGIIQATSARSLP